MEQLSSRQQQILRRCYDGTPTISEVADTLGRSRDALQKQLARLREKLSDCIRGQIASRFRVMSAGDLDRFIDYCRRRHSARRASHCITLKTNAKAVPHSASMDLESGCGLGAEAPGCEHDEGSSVAE